jgi:hypothetical protein
MPLVQIQRRNAHGELVEFLDVDIATPHEYQETIAGFDRRAREEGGSTVTLSHDSPRRFSGYVAYEEDPDAQFS